MPKERYTTRRSPTSSRSACGRGSGRSRAGRSRSRGRAISSSTTIGDETIAIVRDDRAPLHAFHNACLHRGRRLAEGCGSFADGTIRCPYHGWCYALDGRLVDVPDRADFTDLPDDLTLRPVNVETWGGFVFVNLDANAEPLADFLDPLPKLLAPYHLEETRLRASLTTIIDANWKAVVDAFNEGYHVQGLHPQILPWTDDVSIAYEQFDRHAHYGRLPGARRELRPSPRLGARSTTTKARFSPVWSRGLGGAFLGEERAAVEALRAIGATAGPDAARGVSAAPHGAVGRARVRHRRISHPS